MLRVVQGLCVVVAAIFVAAMSAPRDAPLKGIDLAKTCRSAVAEDDALCRGFVDGFTYGAQLAVGPEFIRQWRYGAQTWCFPASADHAALRQTFLAYAQANTGTLHFPAAIVLANAFAAAYACK
ncbi:MAG: hypothetical protein JNM81_12630 [Rhodospirillaceae bacterium]|nr:hypothetical protein [Rhodospirillaceae bacterium]